MYLDVMTIDRAEMHNINLEEDIKSALFKNIGQIIKVCEVFGETNLFHYDSTNGTLALTPPFQDLLKLLISLGVLDGRALENVTSLEDLNTIFQIQQGSPEGLPGGLLRKQGVERMELVDGPILEQHKLNFDALFESLGFALAKSIECPMNVDHCLIFGGLVERMELRITKTREYLNRNLSLKEDTGRIFLLGSTRKLFEYEIDIINDKIEELKFEDSERQYWENTFCINMEPTEENKKECTEANAFAFLWRCLIPDEMRNSYENKIVAIKSTRIGYSYGGECGYRPTGQSTVDDWMSYVKDEPLTIFAAVEKPYMRLAYQLKFSVISNNKKVTFDELVERVAKKNFHFAHPASSPTIRATVDEIGRWVYQILQNLKYVKNVCNDSVSNSN